MQLPQKKVLFITAISTLLVIASIFFISNYIANNKIEKLLEKDARLNEQIEVYELEQDSLLNLINAIQLQNLAIQNKITELSTERTFILNQHEKAIQHINAYSNDDIAAALSELWSDTLFLK